MELTKNEIDYIASTPEGLRLAADYQQTQVTMGEPMGFSCKWNEEREKELLTEAERIEQRDD